MRLGIVSGATVNNLKNKRTFPSEVVEMELSHTAGAYMRTDQFEKRRAIV